MTPPGHAAVGYLAGRVAPRLSMTALILGSVLPDVDFLFEPLPALGVVHRHQTHSLGFAAMAGAAGYAICKGNRLGVGAGLALGIVLHAVVDSMLDDNPTNGIGTALFWPVLRETYSLVNFFEPDPQYAGWSDWRARWRNLWLSAAVEAPFWGSAGYLFVRRRMGAYSAPPHPD